MNRRHFLRGAAGLLAVPALFTGPLRRLASASDSAAGGIEPLEKSDEEWRRLLTPEQYSVLRQEGTERAFTSPLNDEKRKGTYACAGCGLALFTSDMKFDSGTMPLLVAILRSSRVDSRRSDLGKWTRMSISSSASDGR